MNIHIIPSQKFTTQILCVLIGRRLSRQEVTRNALLPALLSRGSAKYPALRDIRAAAEAMQGSIFEAQIVKKGEHQLLQFFLEVAPQYVERGLDFLREIIFNPRTENNAFFGPFVQGECENLKTRIEGRINNKGEYAKLKCIEAMFEGEPFGLFGDGYAEDLPGLTPENLFAHYQRIIADGQMDLFSLGAAENVNTFFKQNYRTLELETGAAQGNLCIGLRGGINPVGSASVHLQLANEILGGGPNAKLFANVREKESLCYSVFSTLYRFKSVMCIQAGTGPDKLEHVLQLIKQEVESLQEGRFGAEDVESAKASLSKRWRALQDRNCIDFHVTQYLLQDKNTICDMLAMVNDASAADIAAAAAKLKTEQVVMLK
jgi:predicted Zn-dependent peptidase